MNACSSTAVNPHPPKTFLSLFNCMVFRNPAIFMAIVYAKVHRLKSHLHAMIFPYDYCLGACDLLTRV